MGKKGSGVTNEGRKLKSINDSDGNVTVVSRSSIDGAAMEFSADMTNLDDKSFGKEQPANVDIGSVPDMPIEDRSSLIATQIGKPTCLILLLVKCVLILGDEAALRISTVDKMNNDCFQMVVNNRKSGKTMSTITNRSGAMVSKTTWQPIKQKVSYEPKARGKQKNGAPKVSSYAKDDSSKKLFATNGDLHVPMSKPSVLTSNPYNVLDNMESDEEVEVVYDETVTLKDTRMGASPFMASDGSNT
uniref:Uncharacterized protein n=1 Tax=Tanacetum cinerariifolium TaxID=118510 RepID=A0A699HJP2_TANCI|nr:hypothetical protein [Tanacetum cinerariifolium]